MTSRQTANGWRWDRLFTVRTDRVRRLGLSAAVFLVAVVLVTLVGVPSLTTYAVSRKLAKAGASGEVGAIRIGGRGLWLSNVKVARSPQPTDEGRLSELQIRVMLGTVLVPWSSLFSDRGIAIGGGSIVLTRVPVERQGSDRHGVPIRRLTGGSHPPISFEGLMVTLRSEVGQPKVVTLHGVRGEISTSWLALGWDWAEVMAAEWRGSTGRAKIGMKRQAGGEMQLSSADVESARWSYFFPEATGDSAALGPSGTEGVGVPDASPSLEMQLEKLARLPLVQALDRAEATRLSRLVEPGGELRVGRLEVGVKQGDAHIWLGPVGARAARSEKLIDVELTSHSEVRPGTIRLEVPLTEQSGAKLSVDIPPIALEALGVNEGDFGLLGVRDARLGVTGDLRLSPDEQRLDWQFHAKAERLAVLWPWLASSPVREVAALAELRGSYTIARQHFEFETVNVSLGALTTRIRGELSASRGHAQFSLGAAVPLVACQDLLDALPLGLAPRLVGLRADGTLSFDGRVSFDSRQVERTDVELTLKNDCRVTQVPAAVAPSRFASPFTLEVDDGTGKVTNMAFGPGTNGWVMASGISPLLGAALQVCEDGRFLRHRGLDVEALRNSLRQNLIEGRFVRGGSTLTMQLAKNLYLRRDKTLARKLEEAVLTTMLEQTLSKAQILELYLNVVEFGRGLYGIGPAAYAYFRTTPDRLTPGQAFFLASILPNPKASHFGPDETLSSGWRKHVSRLLAIAKERNLITEEELTQGLEESIALVRNEPESIGATDAEPESGETPTIVREVGLERSNPAQSD